MMEAEFENGDHDIIRDVVARLGLADVRMFGLSWDDCYQFLAQLGYQAHVEVSEAF